MKIRLVYLCSAMLYGSLLLAQPNLVKNPGFEEISETVDNWGQLERVPGWNNANAGSADIFSKSADPRNVGLPDNEMGTIKPFEGEYCAGIVAWKDDKRAGQVGDNQRKGWNSYSEYLQGELTVPLIEDAKYKVSFRVSLGDNSDRAVSGIGALFSQEMIAEKHRGFLDGTPEVWTTDVIKDKEGWTEISGTFTAVGDEAYIIIGVFSADYMTKESIIEGPDNQRAYYYVDAVSVVPAPVEDSDGDGVTDENDNCPEIAGLERMNGCPDVDEDGIADNVDKCPDKAGPGTVSGCPDTDGDGLTDDVDMCPTAKGTGANKGCPKITEETDRVFKEALTAVKFETGSARLKSSSYGILNQVVKVMEDNPTYDLEIHGHTDSQGNDDTNMKLSADRAASVMKYLIDKGVDAARLKSEGHGETKPVADNSTSAGRAKNRRVQFQVNYWR